MTIKSPPDPMEKLQGDLEKTLVQGEMEALDRIRQEVEPPERRIHHQQSRSEEDRPSNNVTPCHHKQTRSDEVLNRSGPPPVPDNSPQSDCGQMRNRNNSSPTSCASLGKTNSKSMDTLLQTNYAINNVNDNKLHKCASQENLKMSRISNDNVLLPQDESTLSSLNANNSSSSGISIMENLVREFGLTMNSTLQAGENLSPEADNRGPPPKYPGMEQNVNSSVGGAASSNDSDMKSPASSGSSKSRSYESMQESITSGSMGSSTSPLTEDSVVVPYEIDHEAVACRATQMVEILSEENVALRQELETYYQKVSRLQKFEQDIHMVQSAHDMLVESTKKREHLESMVRGKLENEVKKSHDQIKLLNAHLEITKSQLSQREQAQTASDSDLVLEITKRDALLTQLAAQHKDGLAEKQRMAVELGAQRATLNDQRSHIDVLDTALSNAQANVVKLQEEVRRRQPYVEKVNVLQRYLQTLQATYQKRDHLEQKYRVKLERELAALKGHHSNQDEGVSELDGGNSSQTLVELLREREDTILRLETEVTKWEQRYFEEFTLRLCTSDSANQEMLYQQGAANQQEAEMAAAEAQAEKARHQEELQYVNVKFQELEAKINALNSELAQKNMIIEMLRRNLMEKDGIISSLERLPRPMSSSSPQNSQQNIRKSSVESMHTLACSPGSANSLQNLMQRSPVSSQQNLSIRSPSGSHQSLVPSGSHQSLVVKGPSRGPGSQERLLELSGSHTSLSTSGLSTAGTDGSDTDLSKERIFLDEKLQMLDQEIAQQDKILAESLWK